MNLAPLYKQFDKGSLEKWLMSKTNQDLRSYMDKAKWEIINYSASIVNYPPERMEKYGKPFLEKLETIMEMVRLELKDRDIEI